VRFSKIISVTCCQVYRVNHCLENPSEDGIALIMTKMPTMCNMCTTQDNKFEKKNVVTPYTRQTAQKE